MRVTILGTGGIALGYAALLHKTGHEPVLFSLSGEGSRSLENQIVQASGALEHRFQPYVYNDICKALEGAMAVVVATSANNHKRLFDLLVPVLQPGQRVLVSAELSMSGSTLTGLLADAGKTNAVTCLGTTVLTGRRLDGPSVTVGLLRKSCPAATHPQSAQSTEIGFWATLFGDVFEEAPNALTIFFANLNPTVHVGNALCNFTRIENGETWSNYAGITPSVANLTTAIDQERLTIAAAYDVCAPSLVDRYRQMFGFADNTNLNEMTIALNKRRKGLPKGPKSVSSRYVTEDVPFGLVFLEHLGHAKDIATPLHSAVIDVFSAMYQRDFRSENPFITRQP